MFSKKTLGAAIAVALSLGISTTASAAPIALSAISFNQCGGGGTTTALTATSCAASTDTLDYAYEQFSTTKVGLDFPFRVRYRPAALLGKGYDIYVTFALTGGVTWQSGITSSSLTIQTEDGTKVSPAPEIAIVSQGGNSDSSVSFRINTTKFGSPLTTAQILDFQFKLDNAQKALATQGGQVNLTATFKVAQTTDPLTGNKDADTPARTVALARSVSGADVEFQYREMAKAYIDIESDGKTFAGSGKTSSTSVDYGYVKISPNLNALDKTSLGPQSNLFTLTGTASSWPLSLDKFQLTIADGNFAASGVPSGGNVYIDLGNGKKLLATSFSADKVGATWAYTKADDTGNLLGTTTPGLADGSKHNIMLVVNGTDSINENRRTPSKGTMSIQYGGGGGSVTRTATLRHLKRNGSVCSLYNIPPSTALDKVHVRITNDSPSVSGFVKGTLRDMDGKEVFKGKMLIDTNGIVPHQTIHLDMTNLTSDGETWEKRGVLTLESNIPEPYMQVYGLLRADSSGGVNMLIESPLMNLSTGASGNGCD